MDWMKVLKRGAAATILVTTAIGILIGMIMLISSAPWFAAGLMSCVGFGIALAWSVNQIDKWICFDE